MSIVHVNQIRSRLDQTYPGKIDMSDASGFPQTQQGKIFLSRALAAYALEIHAEITPDEAAKAVTDGGDDNGLDAIFVSQRDRCIYLVQSKRTNVVSECSPTPIELTYCRFPHWK